MVLSRFTQCRLHVMVSLKETLRQHGYTPVTLDFRELDSEDVDKMVSRLTRVTRFVVADFTDSESVPHNIKNFVKSEPPTPVIPFLANCADFDHSILKHLKRFPNILDCQHYSDGDAVGILLREHIPALEAKLVEYR